jgi:hypothetical protein
MSKQDRQGVRTASDLEQKYDWGKRFAEIMGVALDAQKSVTEVESSLKHQILEQATSITRDTEKIILSALTSYTQTEDLEDFKRTLKSELEVWAGEITGRVTYVEDGIKEVDGELQEVFNTIIKYFTFDVNGLTIGQVDNPNKVVIDNDEITILVNDKPIQEFKADGTSLIPILKITTALNVIGLQVSEDETHINIDYVGV